MNKAYWYIFLIFTLVALCCCKKKELFDLSGYQSDHAVAIPLINAVIDVDDLLEGDTTDFVSLLLVVL